MTDYTVSARCSRCKADLVFPDDATDGTQIACLNCGESVGTYGDIKKHATETVMRRFVADLKKKFKLK